MYQELYAGTQCIMYMYMLCIHVYVHVDEHVHMHTTYIPIHEAVCFTCVLLGVSGTESVCSVRLEFVVVFDYR